MSTAPPRLRSRRVTIFAATLAATLALIAGCSASGSTASDRAPAGGGAAGAPEADNADTVKTVPDDGSANQSAPDAEQRAIIYTGTLTVKVDDVAAAADRADAIATGLSGSVATDQRTIDNKYSTAVVTVRVPQSSFQQALTQLAAIGEEEGRDIEATDVTDTLVDLDARIAAEQAGVDRVRALLAQANTIAEIMSVESELTQRQADLDSLTQRRAKVGGLVALATITVNLHGPAVSAKPENPFVQALKTSGHGLVVSIGTVIIAIAVLLPWAIVVGAVILFVRWVARLRRRRRSTPTP